MGFLSGKQLHYDLTTKSLITLSTYAVPAQLGVHQSIIPHETNTGRNWCFYTVEAESTNYILIPDSNTYHTYFHDH